MGASGSRSAHSDGAHDPGGPIDSLSSWPKRRSPASLCQLLLQAASQDNTQMYLALLPVELRARVDELARPPWRAAKRVTAVPLPEMGHSSFHKRRLPLHAEETGGFSHIVRVDLPVGDLYRDKRIPGKVLALVDLRPNEELGILLTNVARSELQLIDLDDHELAKWRTAVRPPHDVLSYDPDTGWITCEDNLCHVTRRHRILRYPKGAPRASGSVTVCLWGAEGAERMSAASNATVHVYDLTNGALVYKLAGSAQDWPPRWRVEPALGLLLQQERGKTENDFRLMLYRLSSGTPLAARFTGSQLGCRCNEAVLLPGHNPSAVALEYWTPRDPDRVNRIELGCWKDHTWHGNLHLFVSETPDKHNRTCLVLLWESARAVRTDLDSKDGRWHVWHDVAFVSLMKDRGLHHLYMLRLPPSVGLPSALPDVANAPLDTATEVYVGPTKQYVLPPVGAELDDSPLIVDVTLHAVYLLRP